MWIVIVIEVKIAVEDVGRKDCTYKSFAKKIEAVNQLR